MKALFPGTFDPPTLGHLDLIHRIARLCDHLIIGIGRNFTKKENGVFTIEEKVEMLEEMTANLSNIEICSFSGLVIDFAKKREIDILVRGLRTMNDFTFEAQMAHANKKLKAVDTIFLIADPKYTHIDASLVRELAYYRADLTEFVPKQIAKRILERFQEQGQGR